MNPTNKNILFSHIKALFVVVSLLLAVSVVQAKRQSLVYMAIK